RPDHLWRRLGEAEGFSLGLTIRHDDAAIFDAREHVKESDTGQTDGIRGIAPDLGIAIGDADGSYRHDGPAGLYDLTGAGFDSEDILAADGVNLNDSLHQVHEAGRGGTPQDGISVPEQ